MKQMLWDKKIFIATGFGKIWRCLKTKCTNPEFGSSHKCAFTDDQSWPEGRTGKRENRGKRQRGCARRRRRHRSCEAQIAVAQFMQFEAGRGRKEKSWSRQSRWRVALLQGTARNWAVTSPEGYSRFTIWLQETNVGSIQQRNQL